MRPAISIDFGAAYTKIALRKTPNSTTTLLRHERLRLDEEHVCIPSIAAWRESDDRWIFGADAVDLQTGQGIHVYRNWKPILFSPPTDVLDPESSIGRLFYFHLDGGDDWPPIKKLAVKYFEWLLQVMLPGLLDFNELEDPVLRISLPDFAGEESVYTYQMQEIFLEAGWDSPWVFCEPEPMTNLAGALSQGKNQVTEEDGTLIPDIHRIFSGSGMINYLDLTSKKDVEDSFTMLLVDIGAYTSDFAMVTIDATEEGGLPPCEAHSEPYGIEMLDGLVKHGLSKEKADIISTLSATDREAFRRTVYTENRSWSINNITIGDGEDREIVEKCIRGMTTRIYNEIDDFMTALGIEKIDEVVFTGGGSNIPRITTRLAERLQEKGVKTFHGFNLPEMSTRTVQIGQQVVRGSSAIGGASVLFGDE